MRIVYIKSRHWCKRISLFANRGLLEVKGERDSWWNDLDKLGFKHLSGVLMKGPPWR